MYGQANFFFFFMEAKQLPWNWQVMYQWVGNWVWSLDHFPTTFWDFFVIISVVSNVADSGMRQQCLELFFSCCFQDLVYLLSFTTFSHLFNPHRQAQLLLLLLGGAGANLEFSSKHLVLECFLSTCPILQKTKRYAFWQDEELLERSTHSQLKKKSILHSPIHRHLLQQCQGLNSQTSFSLFPFTVPATSWRWVCHPLGGQTFKTSSCSWGVLLPLLTYHKSSFPWFLQES